MNQIVKSLKETSAQAGTAKQWKLEELCKMAALEIEDKAATIARLTETAQAEEDDAKRKSLRIIAKDMQISELTRMLFALGKQDGQTIRNLTEENRGLRQMLHMEEK